MTATISENNAHTIRQAMRKAQRKRKWRAFLLVAPLALFLLIIFVIPIGALFERAVDNPEVINNLPRTLVALKSWDKKTTPGPAVFTALATDLEKGRGTSNSGTLARRLNYEIPGYRSLLFKTMRHLDKPADQSAGGQATMKDRCIPIDKRWSEPRFWHEIGRAHV